MDFSNEVLEQALNLGTSTLYESSAPKNSALDYNIRPVWDGAKVSGTAYPVSCAPGDNLAIQIALEKAPKGSVLVVTTESFIAGYWGEVLTVAAEAVGIKGLIIDGGVRDIAALRSRKFPVFSRGISMRGTHKDTVVSVGKRIEITGTPVELGDLIVADDDGIIVLPQHCALEVINKGQAREDKEIIMMKALTAGKTTLELMELTQWRNKV